MVSIVVIGVSAFVSIALLGMIGRGGFIYMSNYNPTDKKVALDVEKMKSLLVPKVERLIPWTKDEMPLLSLEQVDVHRKKRGVTVAEGTFISIYQEPMLTYAYKKYTSPQENAVAYARTSDRSFEYRIRKGEVGIKINGRKIGTLRSNGVLYNVNEKMLARVNQESSTLGHPVLLYNRTGNMKELGNIVTQKEKDQINPRALQLVSEDMSAAEESVFLALAIYSLIKKSVQL